MSTPRQRQRYNLDAYRDNIQIWIDSDFTHSQICILLQQYMNVTPTTRTLRRFLARHGISKLVRIQDLLTPSLEEEIKFEFFQLNNNDATILQHLHVKGHDITARQLRTIRGHLGLKRRIRTTEEKLQRINECRSWFQAQFHQSNRLADYGRGYLYDYTKDLGYQFTRDTVFDIYKEFRPDASLRHYSQERRRKGEFIVNGPNHVLSIDGHDKLKRWGIHIYGGIDTYSRFIVWCHVGYYGSTAISTLKQYLRVIRELRYVPRVVRADRGKEVPLLAAAHWMFVKNSYMNEDGSDVEFGDCFYYGRSTDNVRIEHWWSQLLKTCLMRWIAIFERMEYRRLWIIDDAASEIAFLAVYMPILRQEVAFFVRRWNGHKIRAQPNRPNSVKGKPYENFFTPNPAVASQWGLSVDISLLSEVEEVIENVDIDEYLPRSTLEWCETKLSALGLDRSYEDDQEWPFASYYMALRTEVDNHIRQGNNANLELPVRPLTGGMSEIQRRLLAVGRLSMEDINGIMRGDDI